LLKPLPPKIGSVAQLGAGQSIKAYPGFGGLHGKLTMNIRWNTYHEFATIEFDGYRFRRGFPVVNQVGRHL